MYKYCIQMFTHTQNVHQIHIVVAIATSLGIDPYPFPGVSRKQLVPLGHAATYTYRHTHSHIHF